MAVTKQTYTATATWTASDLAGIFRSAFIDAGLMTEWHDSFLSGSVENRVLAVDYGTGTYSVTYYWFMFTTTGAFLHLATGWNTGSDIPAGPSGAGTQFLDWFSTTTTSTSNHYQLISLSASTTATVTRYSSAVTSGYAWFLMRNGSTNQTLHIPRPGAPVASWIDLDKSMFHAPLWAACASVSNGGRVGFLFHAAIIRRSFLGGSAMRGSSTNTDYQGVNSPLGSSTTNTGYTYMFYGNVSGSVFSNSGGGGLVRGIILPTSFNNTNTAYASDSVPVFTGVPYSPYINEALPSDFAVAAHYANNTMAVLDKLIVTASSEEWEILSVANNATITTGASPMFLARVA